MKYHSIFTPALTSLCLLTTTASLASDSIALPVDDPARWFEIEIILFKHISTKEQNTEQFSYQDLSAKKRNALDLLTPYIQPDITSLKQLLPSCGQPVVSFPYGIESKPFNLEANESDENSNVVNDSEESPEPAITAGNEENTNTSSMSIKEIPSTADIEEIEHSTLTQTASSDEPSAQSQYVDIVLPNYSQYPSDSQTPFCVIPADFFKQHLSLDQQAHFSIDGFPVEKLTTTIDGIEQWRADEDGEITWASAKPYLISKDSLRLKSIANSIKRSRNYAPLLHLGWRQIGESRRQAQAVNLFAGENLDLDYQQALTKQETQQNALEVQTILEKRQQVEELINRLLLMDESIVSGADNASSSVDKSNTTSNSSSETVATDEMSTAGIHVKELSIEEELRERAKQQQLDKLFEQFALLNKSENESHSEVTKNELTNVAPAKTLIDEEEVKRIVAQLSADISKPVSPLINEVDEGNAQDKLFALATPLQPWSLDGLLKVYLHQNRYLYINSEFNIIEPLANVANKQKNSQADKSPNEQQVISFKQDRRLITGEIHYFDHPHIGMVVQIRRFDPTKPADEAVTQAKK